MNKAPIISVISTIIFSYFAISVIFAQEIPRDTSFNLQSEFNKQVKYHPNIKIAENGDLSSLEIHKNIEYVRLNNRPLFLDIFHPKDSNKKSFPTIILIHGGGWRSGDKSMEHPIAYELARRGYATVCVEYRLSMEATYPAAIEDIITAIKWIRGNTNKYPFDTDKMAIQGTSAGGQLAALIGTLNDSKPLFKSHAYDGYSSAVNAVVNIDGVLAFIHPDSGEGKDRPDKPSAATLWFNSTVQQNPASRIEASALTHVNANTPPILFINSSIPRFHAGRDDMIAKMRQYNIKYEVHEHENSMHTFWLFHPFFDITVDWIDEFLAEVF
jgi:acetyl esterase/lipase